MFAALKHRNYRLYLSGQFISLIGTWMQQLATSWLVYRLTNSPLWLGVAVFSTQIPVFLFGLYAGAVTDRINKHRLLIWTQSLAGLQALVLAVLSFTGKVTLFELITLNFILGTITAFDMPGRQAFVVQMINDKRDLPNAIALNSSVMNATRLIGPAIAGAAIASLGEGMCFLLNALSYIAVLIALAMMRIEPHRRHASHPSLYESVKEGFASAFGNPAIRAVLLLFVYLSFFGSSFMTILPALAAKIPGDGAGNLGWISSAGGTGAFAGALFLARWRKPPLFGRIMAFANALMGCGLVLLWVTHAFALILAGLFFAGLGMMLQFAAGNTIIQTLVEDDKRGRVMSLFTFSLLGISPFGNLLIGWIAQHFELTNTFLFEGLTCWVGAAVFFRLADGINRQVAAKVG